MKVAVFGAGAVGAFYGARMSEGGADVALIARGAQLAALRTRGLTVITPERTSDHRLLATDDPAEIGPVDVVLFCVKSHDTDEAAVRLEPLLREGTAVVSLQNGIDNEDRIAAAVGWTHVLGGSAYILGEVREPGVVEASGPRRIVFGEWTGGEPTARVRGIVETCRRGGVEAVAATDVRAAKWEKFTLLAAFSAMSAATRLGIGEIRDAPAAREMLLALMAEVWAVGRAEGVALADDLVGRQGALLLSQAPGAAASLRHDLLAGRRMELEALQGVVIELGRRHGIPTPWMAAAYAILQPWARRNALPPAERAPAPV
ncbi:MAG: 2-dehydropantoate 2-reductase [Chloroflexota bacterium]|nr:MAG: 2-dehydropantoate 2-reductase [Chloroflexota bacterium]